MLSQREDHRKERKAERLSHPSCLGPSCSGNGLYITVRISKAEFTKQEVKPPDLRPGPPCPGHPMAEQVCGKLGNRDRNAGPKEMLKRVDQSPIVLHAFHPSIWETGVCIPVSSGPPWFTEQVLRPPRLHKDTLSQKTTESKQERQPIQRP